MHLSKFFGIIVLLVFLATAFPLRAQDTLNTARVEEKSYALYLAGDWKGLEQFGREAFEAGYDYYYLRLRVGVASYSRGNYRGAEKQFRKALAFSSGDPLALEYLYFCYVFSGRYDEARVLSCSFPPSLAHKLKTDSASAISFLLLEGGSKTSDSSRIFQPATYFQAGLGHYVKNRVSVFHAFTYFNEKDFRWANTQYQYYLGLNIPLKNGWSLAPALQCIRRTITPPPSPPPPPGMGHNRPPPNGPPPSVVSTNMLGACQLKKSIGAFDATLGTTVSGLDSVTQFSHSLSLTWFPLGNPRLSLGCTGYLSTSDGYKTWQEALNPVLSFRPLNRMGILFSYFVNNGNNVVESNGYIVNSTPDATPRKWSILGSYMLGKHLDIYALFQQEDKKEAVQHFMFHYNLFVVGLKIKI